MKGKFVLYQVWPRQGLEKYGIVDFTQKATSISVFPANAEGLDKAIEAAERPDALLVKIDKEYFNSESLLAAMAQKVKEGKGIKVFKPLMRLPKGIANE